MRALVLSTMALAAATMAVTPAATQSWPSGAIGSGSAFAGSHGGGSGHAIGVGGSGRHHGARPDRRRDRGFDGAVVYGGWDRDYQGDSAWRANSFNDWWHERPNRSFPRWMQNNQNCERQWWGGGQWRC